MNILLPSSRFRLLMLMAWLAWSIPPATAGTFSVVGQEQWVNVASVFDGDTFQTDDGMKVRLLGINTPEVQHGSEPGQVMGVEAGKALQALIGGQRVRLQLDREQRDHYGRTLAQVWLADGRWVNGILVAEGYAHVYTFAPNLHWAEALLREEHRAIAAQRGIWRTTRFAVLDADAVESQHIGQFRVIEGRIGEPLDRHGWSFNVGRLHVSVPRKYREWFSEAPALHHSGSPVRLRGIIRAGKQGEQRYLALHTPADLEWL